ncbi:MAG: hypothetical protein WCP28_18325 [Actinomycetes bacterium]
MRKLKTATVQRFRCTPDGSEAGPHIFAVLVESKAVPRKLIDDAVLPPPCPLPEHASTTSVIRHGVYTTATGRRQRYTCANLSTGEMHTFSDVLPRAQVGDDTCCDECGVPTPVNAGAEAAARRNSFPISVVHMVLKDLSEGCSYTTASLRALEAVKRPAGRVRERGGQAPAVRDTLGRVGPRRDGRAHWHIAADILETFAPIIVDSAFATIDAEEKQFRAEKLPIVYVADELDVMRTFARSQTHTTAPVVWTMLVVSRTRWEPSTTRANRSNRLLRVRALPKRTQRAWELVLGELAPPDFLICDGASAIRNAAAAVWADETQIVPCTYHALTNITAGITVGKTPLPTKVTDHLRSLTRDAMSEHGPGLVSEWFDELEILLAGTGLPIDSLWNLRALYEPLLKESAVVAQTHTNPRVPISNAGAEILISNWVKPLVDRRGPMFTNLPRTNLLGDLIVAGSNGALLNARTVSTALQDDNRLNGGWAPPGRELTEPKGALGLRDPRVIDYLAEQAAS